MEISNTTKNAPHLSRHSFDQATPIKTNPHWGAFLIGWDEGVLSGVT